MEKDKETIICRCEDITLKEIEDLLRAGYGTIHHIKRVSRCGMGPCQGRTCTPLLLKIIANDKGVDPSMIELPSFRPPVKPVKLGTIVEAFALQDRGDLSEGG